MRKKISEEEIVRALKWADQGVGIKDMANKAGVSIQTIYRWKSLYQGMKASAIKRVRLLERENKKLKRVLSRLKGERDMLKEVLSKY